MFSVSAQLSVMNRNVIHTLKTELRSSLWIIPFIAIPLELVTTRLVHDVDSRLHLNFLGFAMSGAQSLYQAIVSATLAFLVFTFGSLLVAIQVASSQLTPRIIATTLLNDNVVRYTVGLFMFSLMFALSAQNRLDKDVHQFVVLVSALLGISCFAAFFYLIDHASRMLRPISVLVRVGEEGIAVIRKVYPDTSLVADAPKGQGGALEKPDQIVQHTEKSGIVLAVDQAVLVAEGERIDGFIEFVPQVGDFVAVDEPLFNLHGRVPCNEQRLRNAIVFGTERTMEQDPTFAFRIVVDIALRALSPAINDPTTAVLAIDQLHRMLRAVGKRNLRTDERLDSVGKLRLIFRTPNWEDFVSLTFSEIRSCGSSNLQIVRRLRSMIENLANTLPVTRIPAINRELALLDREIEANFAHPEDRALARVADPQGLGGRSGTL